MCQVHTDKRSELYPAWEAGQISPSSEERFVEPEALDQGGPAPLSLSCWTACLQALAESATKQVCPETDLVGRALWDPSSC